MNEDEIIKLIRNKKYSRLSFLKDEQKLEVNKSYYGFLYFLLDLQGDDTKEILVKIVSKYGSTAKAYKYLGYIAGKVYGDNNESHISESFFRKSIELDENDSEIWWMLFCKTNDGRDFLESIKLDCENKDYETISNKLSNPFVCFMNTDGFTKDDWSKLEKIISDENVSGKEQKAGKVLLLSAYYYLERLEDGVNLINSVDKIKVDVVIKYYQSGMIDINLALSKLHSFDFPVFLGDDHGRIYEEYLKESRKGNANSTTSTLIATAFRAKKFQDVVEHYTSASVSDKKLFNIEVLSHIYFALAKYYIGDEVDASLLDNINSNWQRNNNDSNSGLYQALKLKELIFNLSNSFNKKTHNGYPISYFGDYQDAKKLLEEPNLLTHYLYDDLYKELDTLCEQWDTDYLNNKFNHTLESQTDSCLSYDDVVAFGNVGIDNERYDEVIKKVTSYHVENNPTIMTCNILGVCFERQGLNNEAFAEYEKAMDIMEESKEVDFALIENYLKCAKKTSMNLSGDQYQKHRDKLNIGLVEVFKWNVFIAKKMGHLFKYQPFNINTLDALVNNYFYLPSKSQLNDPIEMPELDNIGAECLIDSDYRVCSFSNNENSMLMWSHYTQNHQGIMVEYEFGGELPAGVGVGKVKYTNEIKRNREKNEYEFNQYLLTKNHEWAYEEEVRLLSYKKDKVYYESYEYPDHDRNKINARIVSVTLGCQFDESKRPLIVNVIKNANAKRKSYEPSIFLRQAKISASNVFKLEYTIIDL